MFCISLNPSNDVAAAVHTAVKIHFALLANPDVAPKSQPLIDELSSLIEVLRMFNGRLVEARAVDLRVADGLLREARRCLPLLTRVHERIKGRQQSSRKYGQANSRGKIGRPLFKPKEVVDMQTRLPALRKHLMLYMQRTINLILLQENADTSPKYPTPVASKYIFKLFRPVRFGKSNSIELIDFLGRSLTVPTTVCATWEGMEKYIKLVAEKSVGCSFIDRGDYELIPAGGEDVLQPVDWEKTLKSGMTFELAVIIRRDYPQWMHERPAVKCPRCGLEPTDLQGWFQCPRCDGYSRITLVPEIRNRNVLDSELEDAPEIPLLRRVNYQYGGMSTFQNVTFQPSNLSPGSVATTKQREIFVRSSCLSRRAAKSSSKRDNASLHDHVSSGRIISKIRNILVDREKYKQLLAIRAPEANQVFALLQFTCDLDVLETETRGNLLVAMQKLAQRTELFPTHYELADSAIQLGDDPVAAGAFADIYRGQMYGEDVSVKMIRLYQTSQVDYLMKKFWKEAVLWSQLSHPNLLPMYGLYRFHGRMTVVSPWMENGNIGDYLEADPTSDRQALAVDVAEGLSYLHSLDIVHGDLKGANILVTPAGTACIADFGLSSVSDSKIMKWTSQSSRVYSGGTLRWQAPELCYVTGDEVVPNSKSTDVYAWACVCYEIFTGNIPFFEYSRDTVVLLKILEGERPSRPPPSSPSWADRALTEEIWSLMQDCWSKNPAERPAIQDAKFRLPGNRLERAQLVKWDPPLRNHTYSPEDLDLSILDQILT